MQGYKCGTGRRHVDKDLSAGKTPPHSLEAPISEFINARTAKRHPGGGIDGRSCQPHHGRGRKLSPDDRQALVKCDVLVDQADA